MDTDSIIYTYGEGEYCPKLGSKLGEWTDEIAEKYGPQVEIVEYVANAPKSYSLRLSNGDEIVKLKGVTQNVMNRENVNFSSIYNCVQDKIFGNGQVKIVADVPLNFVRNKIVQTIVNRPGKKVMGFKYNKCRMLSGTYKTVPFGYNP